jgi:hypothetical protein
MSEEWTYEECVSRLKLPAARLSIIEGDRYIRAAIKKAPPPVARLTADEIEGISKDGGRAASGNIEKWRESFISTLIDELDADDMQLPSGDHGNQIAVAVHANAAFKAYRAVNLFLTSDLVESFRSARIEHIGIEHTCNFPVMSRVFLPGDGEAFKSCVMRMEEGEEIDAADGNVRSATILKAIGGFNVHLNIKVNEEVDGKSMWHNNTLFIPLDGSSIGDAVDYIMAVDNESVEDQLFGLRLIVNSLLYYTSSDADVLRRINPMYDRAIRKVARMTGKAKGKAKAAAKKLEENEHFVMGLKLQRLQRRRSDGEAASSSSSGGGDERLRHRVRGHWRWQACGKGLIDHKLIWIEDHMRGSIEADRAYVLVP